MAKQTIAQLRARAQVVRDEVAADANTATRIGALMDDISDSIPAIIGQHWEFRLDSVYTDIAPRNILAGARTQITVDGLNPGSNENNPNHPAIWDPITNKLVPVAENDFYIVRLSLTGFADIAANSYFKIDVDVGGVAGQIFQQTVPFILTPGTTEAFNITIPVFAGADFAANGGVINITPADDSTFWEFGVMVLHAYTPPV